ncbi:hypothetical protein ICE90_10395 [Polynucleobacter sp. AP-RePozz3-80-G7]|nr:hypothetical protein [Polynucleobacter sp. AP-RePozz3-80-G7]
MNQGYLSPGQDSQALPISALQQINPFPHLSACRTLAYTNTMNDARIGEVVDQSVIDVCDP